MADKPKLTQRAKEMFVIIEKYKSSGKTQKEFCKNESISYSTFQWWMNQYRKPNNTHPTTKNNDKHPHHFLPISFKT
jgi:transposase